MFFNKNNDIDDEYQVKKIDLNKLKLPLIILGGIILLIIIILLVSKLFNKNNVVYEDKLYYINLLGDVNITLYLDDIYNEPGYTGKDDLGNDLTSQVVVTNNIDVNKIGNYKVSYTLGNVTKERNVKVIEKPIGATYIHLYGDVNVYLYVGDEYIEKGYEVIDSVDGAKLKDKVTIKSNVNTSKEGIYKVIYSVVNSSGITTSKERTVIVTDRNLSLIAANTDITNGNVIINIYAKDELFDYLILPNNIKVNERVSTYEVSSNGIYKFVMYNSLGEAKEKSIEITNIDREAPSGSCTGYYQNGVSQININASDNVGISKYIINGVTYTVNNIKINSELSSVNITIYDKAGNNKTISCNLDNKNQTTLPSSSSSSTKSSSTKSSSSSSTKSSSSSSKSSSTSYTPPANSKTLNITAGTYERTDYDSEMSYIEVIPQGATTNMPLVIYLDGARSYVNFPNIVLGRSIIKYVQNGNAYDEVGKKFLLISPRYVISDGKNGTLNWYGSHGPREASKIAGLINHIYKKYQIDRSRIYITGVSLGGDGVWYMINAYPSVYAAGTVVSGCAFEANPSNFKTTPILGYNGTGQVEKNTGYTSCVPSMINKIKNAGGTAESRVKSGWDHSSMVNVYSTDKDVFKWMFNYHK